MAEKMNDEYLRVENLHTYFHTPEGVVKSVDGVSFHIDAGETLALVGESGCGKTVTSLSLIRLLADSAEVFADKMTIDRRTIKGLSKEEARKIRGKQMFRLHDPKISKREIYERSVAILKRVGVPKPEERLRVYPHQLSGGLRQRVMIAISLASAPRMLIADEPTTALDVTIQAQIIDLLKSLQKDMNMAILLITHDFGVVSQIADRVAVMYAGKIVESGRLEDIFQDPWHVYTKLLIMSIPGIKVTRGGRLESIAGTVPNPLNWPKGCRFAPRCPEALDICFEDEPPEYVCGERRVRCHLRRGSV